MHANEVRIIGGYYRSRRIHFCTTPGLRPTPDRVRETLFNWLGQDLTGMRCLDAFAGSGALGFEAASRNAARVVMLESNPNAAKSLKKNRERLDTKQIEIVRTDSLRWMQQSKERFDLIFLDPPFASDLMERALPLATQLLDREGWVYVEAAARVSLPEGFILYREGTTGMSYYALFKRESPR